MNIAHRPVDAAPAGVSLVEDASSLDQFLKADCAAAVWNRQMPQDVKSWLAGLAPENLPRARTILPPGAVADAAEQLCDQAGMPQGAERDWLTRDIAELADIFATLVSAKFLRVRVDVVTTNACRKFHIDAIRSRLVCTYRGTGTQYGLSQSGADPAHIWTVGTGAPILLRGTLWPAKPAPGLLHRSPPIEGTGETRLVLVLDPVADPDMEPEAQMHRH